jgi:primary-amine oxidase
MALDRLKSVAHHLTGTPPPHPFDPLSNAEIEKAVSIIRSAHGKLFYNAVTLREPKKKEMLKWLENPSSSPRPTRVADVVALAPGGAVFDGLVDLEERKVIKWEKLEGVQPLVSISVELRKNLADISRLQWRTSRSWSTLSEKTPRSLSNVC